jgi:hypothetical protein
VVRALCTAGKHFWVTRSDIPEVRSSIDPGMRLPFRAGDPIVGRFARVATTGAEMPVDLRDHLYAVLSEYIAYFEQRKAAGGKP